MLTSASQLRTNPLRSRRATRRRSLVPSVVVLALAGGLMTATSGPAPAATDEETAPTGRVLINELSSATSNTYQEPDGTRTLESFTAPVNYQGEEGEWQPIDNTFVDAPGSTYAVENAANAYTAQIPADASTTPVRFTVGDDWVTMRLHGADSAPVVDDNEATFGEMDNADAVAYVATPSGLKENITLDEAPGAGDAQLTYVYSIDASAGLTPFLGAGNEIEFQDAAGEAEIEIPAGLMFDSAEVPSSSGAVEYALDQAGEGWKLTVRPDMSWLRDGARVYPVTVDPGLEATALISNDCWVTSAQPTQNRCGSSATRLGVGRNATPARLRSLLRFDVSEVPNAAIVTGASVNLYLDSASSASGLGADYALFRAGKSFNSGATWNSSGAGGSWSIGGGDPTGAAMGTRSLNGGTDGYRNFDISTGLVQDWVIDGTASNKGLVLKQLSEDVNNVLWFNSSAAAANRPKLVIKYDRTPKAPSALQVTPGGPGYTTSLLPTFSALVSDPDGGSLRATLALLRDDQVVEAWTSGSVPSGTVVEWAVSEALEPDVNYVLRVGASDASSSSAPVTLPIRTDVWAPKVPAATCSGDCVSVPEVTLFDSAASSPLQPNETRLVEVRVPAVADPDDIDRLLARLQVSGAGGSGSLRVFNPEHTRPVAGTLNYVTGSAATTTLEVMPSIPMQLAIHNDGSSPVDAKLIAYAYYPWVDDEFEPLEATEPQSEVPVSSDESVVQFEPVRPLTAEQANAGGGDLPGVDADTQTCSPATDPDDPELDEVCVQAMTPGELEAVVAADHDLALQEAAEAGDATEVAARQAADQARITEINGCPWTAAKGPWTLKGRYSACKVTGMSLTGYKRVQGVKVPKWRFYFYLSEQYESHSNSLSTSHRYRFVYWKNWNKTKMKFVHEDLCVNDEVCDENSYLRYASFGKYDKQTEWFSTTFESAVADQEREELNSVLKLTGYWTRNVMRPSPEVRCDRLRYIPSDGCVLKNYTPTWELSRGGYPESADHIADSQAGGIAGSPSSGSPLQRKYWFGKKNLNRKDAKRRCSNYPRPAGYDCDEYPMSTTYDGCYLSGVCHVRWIPPSDNRGSGAKLGAFYRSNRVAEKDLFWVRIVS